MDVETLVDEHPFDVGLQIAFIDSLKNSAESDAIYGARMDASQLVDFDDSGWCEFIQEASRSTADVLAEVIKLATRSHPSVPVLTECTRATKLLVACGWNSWTLFKPRSTSIKSALRYVEHALDRVSLWPDSHSLWSVGRDLCRDFGEPPIMIQKMFVRQIQAVPMSEAESSSLIEELRKFESDHSLAAAKVDSALSLSVFEKWKDLEARVSQFPSAFMDMIRTRTGVDPEEYVHSLHARSVIASPRDPELWFAFIEYASGRGLNQNMILEIVERGVKNCPYEGRLWVQLARVAIKLSNLEMAEHALTYGITALRDSAEVASRNVESLKALLLLAAQAKLETRNSAEIRESFSATVSILSELSSLHTVDALVSWLHVEASVDCLRDLNDDFGRGLLLEFLNNPEFEEKRRSCSPLHWVQMTSIFQRISDFKHVETVALCRSIYEKAVHYLEGPKQRQIVIQDWILFERSFGRKQEVCELQRMLEENQNRETNGSGPKKQVVRSEEHLSRPSDTVQPEKKRAKKEEPLHVKPRAHAEVVFVNNLPFSVDEYRLTKFFEADVSVGTPKRVLIVRDPSGKSKGFGYVEFRSASEAEQALHHSGSTLDGRTVSISESTRAITDKRPAIEPPQTFEEEKTKTNDYFRNLVLQKQKIQR